MENPMKRVIVAALVAMTVTVGIAFAGITSLASGAAVMINASLINAPSHLDLHVGSGTGGALLQTTQEAG
jgi:hypothetical protein